MEVFKKTDIIPKTLHNELSKIPENFCFLFVGHWLQGNPGHDRKDVGGLIKTFLETFRNTQSNKPALILKTSEATFSVSDRERILSRINEIKESEYKPGNIMLKVNNDDNNLKTGDLVYFYNIFAPLEKPESYH